MISIHEANDWDSLISGTLTITNSAASTQMFPALPGIKYVVIAITATNLAAGSTRMDILSAATRLFRINLPAVTGNFSVANPGGLYQTNPNEALNVQCSSGTADVDVTISALRVPTAP
jgi:hypothetical protein